MFQGPWPNSLWGGMNPVPGRNFYVAGNYVNLVESWRAGYAFDLCALLFEVSERSALLIEQALIMSEGTPLQLQFSLYLCFVC
jgi:hypothetical protein